jgi:hypothetical protein
MLIIDGHGFDFDPNRESRPINEKVEICDRRLTMVDRIISPTIIYFKNIESPYYDKCRFVPYSFNNLKYQYTSLADFNNFFNRIPKILVPNGAYLNYPFRNILYHIYILKTEKQRFIEGIKAKYLSEDIKDDVMLYSAKNEFKNIVEIMPSCKLYNRSNTTYNEERGFRFIRHLQQYMAVFILFGHYPIDFMLCKILESMLAGNTVIIEYKPYLKSQLGLQEYVHYVPLLVFEGKLVLDVDYYKQYLNTDLGFQIAKRGHEYAIEHFCDERVALLWIEHIQELNANHCA